VCSSRLRGPSCCYRRRLAAAPQHLRRSGSMLVRGAALAASSHRRSPLQGSNALRARRLLLLGQDGVEHGLGGRTGHAGADRCAGERHRAGGPARGHALIGSIEKRIAGCGSSASSRTIGCGSAIGARSDEGLEVATSVMASRPRGSGARRISIKRPAARCSASSASAEVPAAPANASSTDLAPRRLRPSCWCCRRSTQALGLEAHRRHDASGWALLGLTCEAPPPSFGQRL
jgi:hypothetical protein